MKLAGMTASIAGKAAKNSLKHLSSDEEKRLQARSELMQDVGIQIAETLGEMKGAGLIIIASTCAVDSASKP